MAWVCHLRQSHPLDFLRVDNQLAVTAYFVDELVCKVIVFANSLLAQDRIGYRYSPEKIGKRECEVDEQIVIRPGKNLEFKASFISPSIPIYQKGEIFDLAEGFSRYSIISGTNGLRK